MQDEQNKQARPETPGVHIEARDGIVRIEKQEIHYGPTREYCPCCNAEVLPRDATFRCAQCNRMPVHDTCRDKELDCCSACATHSRFEEQQRERCGRLALDVSAPCGTWTVFLFAKRTLQAGRAREEQLGMSRARGRNAAYEPRANDLIFRVVCNPENRGLAVNEARSRLVSRAHAALRIARRQGRERAELIDCGCDGSGSSNGTWVGSMQMPRGKWTPISDDESLELGRDIAAGMRGLGIRARVVRGRSNPSDIASVVLTRDDDLSFAHRYIIVAREADIGFGPEAPISLLEDQSALWGSIFVEQGRFCYRRHSGSPLCCDGCPEPGASIPLRDGLVFEAGAFKLAVRSVGDRDFYDCGGVRLSRTK